MMQYFRRHALLVAWLLGTALPMVPMTVGADQVETSAKAEKTKAEKKVEESAQKQTSDKRKKVIEEATAAVRETENALKALADGKNDAALAALETATGKLEIILAREPKLALAPAGVNTVVYDVVADLETLKATRLQAEELLEEGRLQDARHLIRDLASEVVIEVTNIPLATYPDAMKSAAKLIDQNDLKGAQEELQAALNTLVVMETIIPMPIVLTEALLKEAETLAEKKDRTEEENKRLAALLEDARKELKFAEALGYGSEEGFEKLYAQLTEIEEKTAGGKSGEGFFSKITASLSDLFASSQPETVQ